MKPKVIHVGVGEWGTAWCERFLPASIEAGLVEVVAAVDLDRRALATARRQLALPPSRCLTDVREACARFDADFVTVVVPPNAHETVIDRALEAGLHVLSEKPIADTIEATCRIARKVEAADRKMAVTMNHRFDQDKTSLRRELRSGAHGRLDYLVMRFTCDCRQFGSWGAFRHEIDDPLLIEGGIHHVDLLADLAGARVAKVYARTWTPPWGEFAGDAQAHALLEFENGVHAVYEAAKTNAVALNDWTNDYVRAECELATLVLDQRQLECFPYDGSQQWHLVHEGTGQPIPLQERDGWGHVWLIEQFVAWLDGGPPMATRVGENLHSSAALFAMVESARSGLPVVPRDVLSSAIGA